MEKNIVFSLQSNNYVAEKVAKHFSAELGVVSIDTFADGEGLVKTLSDVKDNNNILFENLKKHYDNNIFLSH